MHEQTKDQIEIRSFFSSLSFRQPMFHQIVPIELEPGQEITGQMLSKVIRYDKIVYLLPDGIIPGMEDEVITFSAFVFALVKNDHR